MQTLSELKQGMEELWGSVAKGWRHLTERMSGALTRFKRHGPEDNDLYLASANWALLAGDVYEDERKIVVRLEVPGLENDDFHIQVAGDTLIVSGEKRFEREASDELRVQLNLAKLEAREEWDKTEEKLQHFKAKLEEVSGEAIEASEDVWASVKMLGEEIERAYKRIKSRL